MFNEYSHGCANLRSFNWAPVTSVLREFQTLVRKKAVHRRNLVIAEAESANVGLARLSHPSHDRILDILHKEGYDDSNMPDTAKLYGLAA